MATSQPKGIESIAKEVHSFERTLFRLVAGSFVISGVSSFINVSAAPRSQIAITTLIGTLAGCCAVVVTYLDWPNLPDEQDSSLMLFDSRMKSLRVKVAFFLSAVFFICYVEAPATSEWIALACDALAIYFLFSALVTGALASREIDRQEALWNKLDDAGRQLWSQRRDEEKSQQVELAKFVYRLGKLIGRREYRQVGDLIRPLFRS